MRLVIFVALALIAVPASAKEQPLPDGIKVITETQSKDCKFIDVVTSSANFLFRKAGGATRDALIKALTKARENGANSAVMTSVASANKETSVTLTAYSCPEDR